MRSKKLQKKSNSKETLNKKEENNSQNSLFDRFFEGYYSKLNILLVIPILLLTLSIFTISQAIQTDGTAIYRDISLKGGLSITLTSENYLSYTSQGLEEILANEFSDESFSIQELQIQGNLGGFIIDSSMEEEELVSFLSSLQPQELTIPDDYTSSFIAPSLSQAFFTQALNTLLISFILISIVVFGFFRKVVPSLAIIVSILFDLVVTIGLLNLFGVEVSIAGIGALLMLIGYSIDTDILLTNRVVKEEKSRRTSNQEHFKEKFKDSFKTGMLMGATTLSAATVALIVTNSAVIFQITLIIIIGLIVDMISTWIQNAFILKKWYENLKE